MKLFIILIVWVLERYFQIGSRFQRYIGLDAYLARMQALSQKLKVSDGLAFLLLVILPPVLLISLIDYNIDTWLFGAVNFLFSLCVLLPCVAPQPSPAIKGSPNLRQVLWPSYEQFFAVFFWFALLGPAGAVLYYLSVRLQYTASGVNQSAAAEWSSVLDWPPLRLVTLLFAVVGNFSTTFSYWLDHVLSGTDANASLFTECGKMALGLPNGELPAAQQGAAKMLAERVLIVLVLMVVLLTVGAWV
jgi:membrane protein required for beta-lactamase induction